MRHPSVADGIRGRLPRRRLLQVGLPVGAAAIAIACGGGGSKSGESAGGGGGGGGGTPSTGGAVASQAGAVDKIQPGHYFKELAASK